MYTGLKQSQLVDECESSRRPGGEPRVLREAQSSSSRDERERYEEERERNKGVGNGRESKTARNAIGSSRKIRRHHQRQHENFKGHTLGQASFGDVILIRIRPLEEGRISSCALDNEGFDEDEDRNGDDDGDTYDLVDEYDPKDFENKVQVIRLHTYLTAALDSIRTVLLSAFKVKKSKPMSPNTRSRRHMMLCTPPILRILSGFSTSAPAAAEYETEKVRMEGMMSRCRGVVGLFDVIKMTQRKSCDNLTIHRYLFIRLAAGQLGE
ncbi:hypothetical protein BDQ17DRAFT_1332508 [Cyathus striatus]|nr:hypothetical protein BDQ17DRAFT_1332508 [Cyathus striatus]